MGKYYPESFGWRNTISPLPTNSPIIGNVDANRNIKTTCIWLNLMPDTNHVVKYLSVLWLVTGPEHATCSSYKNSSMQVQFQPSANHTGFTGRLEIMSVVAVCMFRKHGYRISLTVQRLCELHEWKTSVVYILIEFFFPLPQHNRRSPNKMTRTYVKPM